MLCLVFVMHGNGMMRMEGGTNKQGVHGVWCLANENENPLSRRSFSFSSRSALHWHCIGYILVEPFLLMS